jgi:FRG domain
MEMSLNGQWIARYSGTNTGLLIVELDDYGDHYEGNGVLFDDRQEFPNSVVSIRTPSKATAGRIEGASIRAFDKMGNLMDKTAIDRFKSNGFNYPDKANIDFELKGEELSIEWITSIATSGKVSAIAPKTKGGQPSEITPLPIHTWEEFKRHVNSLEPRRYIFRGQENNGWRLRSSFHRTGRAWLERYVVIDIAQLNKLLSSLTTHWFDLINPLQYGAFLNLVQHHGYPTPLLDWTWSPYVASFFAFRRLAPKSEIISSPAIRIYKFDLWEWNRLLQVDKLFLVQPHVSVLDALAFDNTRVIPQQAISTISNIDDIESHIRAIEGNNGRTYLQAIDLPAADRQAVMQELAMMGLTAGALFPGIDGACESLREQNFSIIKTHAAASRAPVVKFTP